MPNHGWGSLPSNRNLRSRHSYDSIVCCRRRFFSTGACAGGACGATSVSFTIGYDALGRMTSKTDQANKATQYGYDPLGRLTSVTQFLNGNPLVTSYGYDEVGNRISQADANNHTTSYAYDQLGAAPAARCRWGKVRAICMTRQAI